MTSDLAIISPVYRTRAYVDDFVTRLGDVVATLGLTTEIVLVDDHCPDRTGRQLARHPGARHWTVLRLERNVGQHAAIGVGVAASHAPLVALLDADLQDRPEDIVILLDAMKPELDVVAAGRHGTYTSPIRRGTGRLFRTTRWMLSSGRIPADAGMFLVARRPALRRALAAVDPGVHILSALARAGAEIESIPIDRDSRPGSGYAGFGRAAMAARALAGLTPLYAPVARHRRRRWSPPTVEVLTAIDAEGPS